MPKHTHFDIFIDRIWLTYVLSAPPRIGSIWYTVSSRFWPSLTNHKVTLVNALLFLISIINNNIIVVLVLIRVYNTAAK